MRIGFILLFSFLFPMAVWSASGKSEVSEIHGPISLGLGVGYGNYRLMNSDGTWASYRGANYLGALEVRVISLGSGAISLFGDYSYSIATDASDQSAKLEHMGTSYGLRFYPVPYMFVGVGMGNGTEKTTSGSGVEASIKHSVTKMELGFEWNLGGSFSMGFQGHYQSGPVSIDDNKTLPANSSFDAVEGLILLIWSPPVLVVNQH